MRITHPFHPLVGREIDVVERRCTGGEDRIFYRDPDGYLLSLPARWTSVEAEDPFVVVAAGRSRFRAVDLIDLAALVWKLRAGKPADGV
ncbi:MAG: DUF5372 family protein [Vicinamibacterales bacterium]